MYNKVKYLKPNNFSSPYSLQKPFEVFFSVNVYNNHRCVDHIQSGDFKMTTK